MPAGPDTGPAACIHPPASIALFAALYVRAATRNEKRYRLLEENG